MMSEQKGNVIRQVLNLIEYGNISQTEAVQRLEAMIQSEIEKQDESADMELVTACEELLWQINTHGRIAFEDKHKESKAILMRRLARARHRAAAIRMGLRAVAVAAAILVLVVVGDGILNREWLFGHSSDDEQQYAIQGQVIDPGLVEDGNASGEDAAGVLTTTDWDAAVAFLGTEPTVPTRLPEGWSVKQYHATRFDDELILNVSYINEGDPDATLLFLWDHYFSVEAANLALEQNADGEWVEIDGLRVYMTSNMEKTRYAWIDGMTVCSLTTSCRLDEIASVVASLMPKE